MKFSKDILKLATSLLVASISVSAAPNFDMVGYATVSGDGISTTTGGAGGKVVTISTLAALESWAASREKSTTPEIAQITGKISSASSILLTIKNGANISIIGTTPNSELANIGLNIRDYNNVIIQKLKIHEVLYPNDALTFDNVNHGWVDRCELYSKIGAGITVDTYDGLLDLKKGSRYITISWCYLHDHMKCSLIGHTDSDGQKAEDSQISVTYHHNMFYKTDGRNPSIRYGKVHMFNNYFSDITDYGIAARIGAHAKLENNHYNNVKLPMTTNKFTDDGNLPAGFICETGNIFTGTCGANSITEKGCEFWTSATLPYKYTLDAVNTVEATVKANSGLGTSITVSNLPGMNNRNINTNRNAMTVRLLNLKDRNNLESADIYNVNGKKITRNSNLPVSRSQGIYILKYKNVIGK
jgi:pectate lyase